MLKTKFNISFSNLVAFPEDMKFMYFFWYEDHWFAPDVLMQRVVIHKEFTQLYI